MSKIAENHEEETIMEFPCKFPVKAMGLAGDGFDILVVGIIRKHVSNLTENAVKSRMSQGGKYISITVEVMAESKQQLDNIYLDLTAHEKVLWVL